MAKRYQRIRQVGDDAGIILPASWLSRQGLTPGSMVSVEVTDHRINVFPEGVEWEIEVDTPYAKLVEHFLRKHSVLLKRLAK